MAHDYLYQFIPCGQVPRRNDNVAIWVRHKTRHEIAVAPSVISAQATATGAYVDTPDREIYFDRSCYRSDGDRPLRNWDECVLLSYIYHTGDDFPLTTFMINHSSMSPMELEMGLRSNLHQDLQTCKEIVCDSGGFQLRSGKEYWIDPEHLTDYYNNNVDFGVTLDVPIPTFERGLLTRMLNIQTKNSKLLMRGVDPGIRLANVAHGFNHEDFIFVREKLFEDDRMDILCIPSSVILPNVKSIDRLAYHVTHGMEYSHYHLLGNFNMIWISLAIKFMYEYSKLVGEPIKLTSDASSSVYSALALGFQKQPMPYKPASRWDIGRKAPLVGSYNLPNKLLPCQCPICSLVKYQDAMNVLGDVNPFNALIRHNEIEAIRWSNMMCEAAAVMPTEDYMQLCLSQAGAMHQKQIIEGFAYMDMFLQEGGDAKAWDKTHRKYKHRLSTLFTNNAVEADQLFETSHDGVLVNEDISALNRHLDGVLQRYEYYYRTGKKPKIPAKNGGTFFDAVRGGIKGTK